MSDLNHILSQSDCLSQEQMDAYLSENLNKEQTHAVECHLADCMFCSDAIDGLSILTPEENKQHIGDIKSGIEALLYADEETSKAPVLETTEKATQQTTMKATKGGKQISWRAAAGLFLLIFAGGLAVFSYVNNNTNWMKPEKQDFVKGKTNTKDQDFEENKTSGRELENFEINTDDIKNLENGKAVAKTKDKSSLKNNKNIELKAPKNQTGRELADNRASQTSAAPLPAPPAPKLKSVERARSTPNQKVEKEEVSKLNSSKLDKTIAMQESNAGSQNTYTQPLSRGKLKSVKDINEAPAVTQSEVQKKSSRYRREAESVQAEDIDIVQSQGLSKKAAAVDYYSEGIYAFNQAKYKESVKLLKRALRDKNLENREDAMYYLALAYEKTNNLKKARKIYEQLSKSKNYQSRSQSRLKQLPTK